MYRYTISVEPADLMEWRYAPTHIPGNRMAIVLSRRRLTTYDMDIDTIDYHKIGIFYSNSLEDAERLAADLATQRPGSKISIFELKSVSQTGFTPVKVSNYTEKGLVPR